MKIKKISITIILTLIIIMLSGGGVKAALQANPSTHTKKTDSLTNWVKNIRQMETADGAMGLSETLKSDLTSDTSNGIDVHAMRTTEYGALAILSASGYGNPSNDKEITTTTGNNTGVMIDTTKWEWTAGGAGVPSLSGVNSKYYDIYTGGLSSAKRGDALGNATTTNPGCTSWHSATDSSWTNTYAGSFARGSGGIFSFNNTDTYSNGSYWCRAVAVVGAGL